MCVHKVPEVVELDEIESEDGWLRVLLVFGVTIASALVGVGLFILFDRP